MDSRWSGIRPTLALLSLLLVLTNSDEAMAREIVRVGVYEYAPYVMSADDGSYYGLTPDLIALLNESQDAYEFTLYPVSAKRRYQAFSHGDFDMIFFESPDWDWQHTELQISAPFNADGEVYVALNDPGRSQDYFDNLQDLRLLGVLGFHYGFAGRNADENYLRDHYRITLSWSNQKTLQLLCERHGDIAIVNRSFLAYYLRHNPDKENALLVSDHYDQIYQHHILISPEFIPGAEQMNHLLAELKQDGRLKTLFAGYGINECSARQLAEKPRFCFW